MATSTSAPTRMFIAGAWEDALSGDVADATSPATGEQLGPVAQGDRDDARRAIAAAKAAFPAWERETAFARAAALRRVADVCERRREELARALTLDQGKPLHAEAYDEVDELVAMWRGAAEDGIRLEGAIPPSMNPGHRVLLVRRPLGPIAVVTPWNWPYTMPAEIVAPGARVREHGRVDAGAEHGRLLGRCSPSASPRPTCRPASSTSSPARGPRSATRWSATRTSPASASSARPRPACTSRAARPARPSCSRWAATARSS